MVKKVVFLGGEIHMVTGCWMLGGSLGSDVPWPSMAIHGPGVLVDRFGSSAVVTFEVVGSVKLELLVQDGRQGTGELGQKKCEITHW